MKRMYVLMMLVVMIALVGCSTQYSESDKVEAPNWTEDGKIIYVKEHIKWKTVYNPFSQTSNQVEDKLILMESSNDGSEKREIGEITEYWSAISTSEAGGWVVIGAARGDNSRMYVMKRDGSELYGFTYGLYPDLSPDGSKIVYSKKGEGIWIMNRDGSGDHQIVNDTTASYPSWSPDDTLIAYGSQGKVYVLDLRNNSKIKEYDYLYFPYWYTSERFVSVYASPTYDGCTIVDIISDEFTNLPFSSGYDIKATKDGNNFIAYDGSWFIINRDGTNKHYIEP